MLHIDNVAFMVPDEGKLKTTEIDRKWLDCFKQKLIRKLSFGI